MKVGPSDSVFRNGIQITLELLQLRAVVVSVEGKGITKMSDRFKEDERK
jgi:hypothetical protein